MHLRRQEAVDGSVVSGVSGVCAVVGGGNAGEGEAARDESELGGMVRDEVTYVEFDPALPCGLNEGHVSVRVTATRRPRFRGEVSEVEGVPVPQRVVPG